MKTRKTAKLLQMSQPDAIWLGIVLLLTGTVPGCIGATRFSGTIANVTATVGRDASLSCTVEDLGTHRVGWIHLKRQMIVAVHTRMITRISRYSVTHDNHKTWTLHISSITEDDRGYYMCQVNTEPAISQLGFVNVVVPPNILDKGSSKSEIQVREKSNVTLKCVGEGYPDPKIKWKREDGKIIDSNSRNPAEVVLDGETLTLTQVSRTHMGAYLCIASNGVPPSVSKRINLYVEFPPQIHVPNQLVGVPTGDNVTIECFVEAFPKAISYWVRNDMMILNSSKYLAETIETLYRIHMKLTIYNFTRQDNTTYKCVAKNSLGETEGDIKLNEIYMPPKAKEVRSENSKADDVIYGVHGGGGGGGVGVVGEGKIVGNGAGGGRGDGGGGGGGSGGQVGSYSEDYTGKEVLKKLPKDIGSFDLGPPSRTSSGSKSAASPTAHDLSSGALPARWASAASVVGRLNILLLSFIAFFLS